MSLKDAHDPALHSLGIVGHEAAKFDTKKEVAVRNFIDHYIERTNPKVIVSGHCHLGGVDIWAEEAAAYHGLPTMIFAPKVRQWSAKGGFRDRNLEIARHSDLVLVIVVRKLRGSYDGMPFPTCYHCSRHRNNCEDAGHVKSGACWTAWEAVRLGKRAEWFVV